MMIQAPVIEVDRSDDSLDVIAYEHLRVHKARRIFIYLYTRLMKDLIVRFCKRISNLLVRDARKYQFHVDTALRSEAKRRLELSVEYQIR